MRWISRTLVIITLLLIVGFIFLITPLGFQASLSLLQKQLPGKLTFETVNGTIFGPINFTHMKYESDALDMTAQKVHLEWRLPMLLFARLAIADFRGHHIVITRKNPSRKQLKTPTQKLSLPLGLTVEHAHIDNLIYALPTKQKSVTIKRLSFNRFKLTGEKIRGDISLILSQPYAIRNFISLDGKLSDYRFNWMLIKKGEKFYITGHGNQRSAYVLLNKNHLFGGSLHGKIALQWYPYLTWNSRLNITAVNFKRFDARLPKIDHATLNSTGIWQDTLPRFNSDASLNIGNNSITLKGGYHTGWDLTWKVLMNDIRQVVVDGKGKLHAQGRIVGQTQLPQITLQLTADHLRAGDYHAQALHLNAALDLSQKTPSHVSLGATRLYFPNVEAKKLEAFATSSNDFSKVNVHLKMDNAHTQHLVMDMALLGQLRENTWQGQLSQLKVHSDEIGEWQTKVPSALALSTQSIALQNTCLLARLGSLCLALAFDPDSAWHIHSYGHLQHLNSLSHLFSKYLSITSPALFKIDVSGHHEIVDAINANFTTQAGHIEYQRHFENFTVPFKQMIITAKTKQNDLRMEVKAVTDQSDHLIAHLTLPNLLSSILQEKERAINGSIKLHFSKLHLLQFFIPQIAQPTGIIQGSLSLAGTIENPSLKGTLSLENGHVDIPALKIKLDKVALALRAEKHIIHYTLSAQSDGEPIKARGSAALSADKMTSTLYLSGENILIANTPEYTIYANPHLTLTMHGETSLLSGSIFIPRAIIKPADFSPTVTLSDDAILIRPNKTVKSSSWLWLFNLKITLGDAITVDTYGLKGKVTGGLDIISTAAEPKAVATGQLHLQDAAFNAQGKKLTIEPNSYINYAGDLLENPHLNLRASRTVTVLLTNALSPTGPTQTQVGIDIKGTVKKPRVTMFSSPLTLSQADIISYLLFNQAASGNSAANISAIAQTIQSLKLGGKKESSSLAQIQQSLGIAELGVQQQLYIDALGTPFGVNQSGFVIGKYLTPKIYIRYSHGLITPIDIYQLRYIINKSWAIQSEIGSGDIGSGMDLLYTISRKNFPW